MAHSDDDFEIAAREFDEGRVNKGLWERLFSATDGDLNKTRARYISERVQQIRGQHPTSPTHNVRPASDPGPEFSKLFSVPPILEDLPFFSNGTSRMSRTNESGTEAYGYIDTNGHFITPPQFSDIEYFPAAGVAMAAVGYGWSEDSFDRKSWGIIDSTGRFLVEPTYRNALRVNERIFLIEDNNNTKRLFDVRSRVLRDVTRNDLVDFHFAGRPLMSRKFYEWDSKGFWDRGKIDRFGYLDRSQKWVIKPQFDETWDFEDERAVVGTGPQGARKYWLIDQQGRPTSTIKCDWISPLPSNPLYQQAKVRTCANGIGNSRLWFHTDLDGNRLYPDEYLSVGHFLNNVHVVSARSRANGKWGLIDIRGKFVVPPEYEDCEALTPQLFSAKVNGQSGIRDFKGIWVTPPSFESISYVGDGFIAASVKARPSEKERFGLIPLSRLASN